MITTLNSEFEEKGTFITNFFSETKPKEVVSLNQAYKANLPIKMAVSNIK